MSFTVNPVNVFLSQTGKEVGHILLLNVRGLRDYFTAVLMYRCIKGDAPFYLTTHFTAIQQNHIITVQDGLYPMCMYQDRILSCCIKVLFYGTTDLKCSNNVMAFKKLYKQKNVMFYV